MDLNQLIHLIPWEGDETVLKIWCVLKVVLNGLELVISLGDQQTFREVKEKFLHDLEGIERNNVDGLAFITNQELTLSQRSELVQLTDYKVDVFHLERVVNLLNSTGNYGVRLEFLDIQITVEERLAYFAEHDKKYDLITSKLEKLEKVISNSNTSEEDYIEEPELFEIRTIKMVSEIVEELFDKTWYDRHQVLKYKIETCLPIYENEYCR